MKTLSIVTQVLLIMLSSTSFAQETQTLMGSDTDISHVWGVDLKTASIQGDIGTEYKVHTAAVFNNSVMLGFAAGLNLTHPKLNHGYLGAFAQYTYQPSKVVHYSANLLLGTGSAKGYPAEKSSALDNMGNITGPSFYFLEPGVNVEVNLTNKSRLLVGLSYRLVTGLGELSFTQEGQYYDGTGTEYTFTDSDMSGVYFNLGVILGKQKEG